MLGVSRRLYCDKKSELLLSKFAAKENRPEINAMFANYIGARKVFCDLIDKYEIFSDKTKSVEDAAKLVGLRPPKAK
jgi:hypothetical protein